MAGSADSALGILGVDLDANDVSAQHDQGVEVATQDGRAIYAKAAANTPRGSLCRVAPASATATLSAVATMMSTGVANTQAGAFAINQVDVSANQYGWFYTEANRDAVVRAAAGCEPGVPLYMTGTAGVVDDATVSAARVEGLRVLESAASASTPPAIFHNLTHLVQDIA